MAEPCTAACMFIFLIKFSFSLFALISFCLHAIFIHKLAENVWLIVQYTGVNEQFAHLKALVATQSYLTNSFFEI